MKSLAELPPFNFHHCLVVVIKAAKELDPASAKWSLTNVEFFVKSYQPEFLPSNSLCLQGWNFHFSLSMRQNFSRNWQEPSPVEIFQGPMAIVQRRASNWQLWNHLKLPWNNLVLDPYQEVRDDVVLVLTVLVLTRLSDPGWRFLFRFFNLEF